MTVRLSERADTEGRAKTYRCFIHSQGALAFEMSWWWSKVEREFLWPGWRRPLLDSHFILIAWHGRRMSSNHIKTRVLRDMKRRTAVQTSEVLRRAYLYVARNQTLPPQVRHQAQLQLNSFHKDTLPAAVKNRCIESGRGRGIMSEFGLCRVSRVCTFPDDLYTECPIPLVSISSKGS